MCWSNTTQLWVFFISASWFCKWRCGPLLSCVQDSLLALFPQIEPYTWLYRCLLLSPIIFDFIYHRCAALWRLMAAFNGCADILFLQYGTPGGRYWTMKILRHTFNYHYEAEVNVFFSTGSLCTHWIVCDVIVA